MSEDAQGQAEDWLKTWDTFQQLEMEQMVRNTQMVARAISLQTAGLIPMHTDLDWVNEAVQSMEIASLRSKGTDER